MIINNLRLSLKNKKLKKNEDDTERFIIWSIPAISTCPYATESCKKFCYAMKAQRMYKATKKARELNLIETKKPNFVNRMIDAIETISNKPSYKNKKIYFRIHESGDFYNTQYLQSWYKIAEALPHIKFLAYTKSFNMVDELHTIGGHETPSNLILRASIVPDTSEHQRYIATQRLNLPLYEVGHAQGSSDSLNCINDCSKCKACYDVSNHKIYNKIH